MMKHLHLLLAAHLLAACPASAQPPVVAPAKDAVYDLGIDHGVNFLNGSMSLSQFYTVADVQTRLKDLWGWAKYKGWSDAEIMSLGFAEAAWHDLFWRGNNGDYAALVPSQAVNIHVGVGEFRATTSLPVATGMYTGEGSRFHDEGYPHSYGSTEWYIDYANWKKKYFPDHLIMRSTNWGRRDALGGWCHHLKIADFHFNGRRRSAWMPTDTIQNAGVAIWDMGEASVITHCYFENFEKDGILFVGGTPSSAEYCSFFTNSRFGVAVIGGGNVMVLRASGDENGVALIGGRAGYGRPSAGQITCIGSKNETGTSPQFAPFKGSAFIDWDGWGDIAVVGCTYASTIIYPYCFIRVKPDVNVSSISVSGCQFFGNSPKVLLYDEQNNLEYGFQGNAWANAHSTWDWHQQHGMKSPWITATTAAKPVKGRLQHVGQDGATSWATAGIYNPSGGYTPVPPSTCTWVVGTETCSACSSGQQTCITPYVSSVSGCTPTATKPADVVRTQVCGSTPPSGTTIETVSNFSNASATYGVAKSWAGVRTLVFTDLKPTALNYQMVCNNGSKGVLVLPNGSMVLNTSGGDQVLLVAGTLKVGTAWSGTVTLPQATDFTRMGALPGAGNAFQGSWKTMVVRK